eukprot:1125041-Prorocentrum_lima.AAC.1
MAQNYRNQVKDLKNKLDDLEKKHLDDVTAMQSRANEELVLRAQIESLQEELSNQAQHARVEELSLIHI